jgi:hypothetical protein
LLLKVDVDAGWATGSADFDAEGDAADGAARLAGGCGTERWIIPPHADRDPNPIVDGGLGGGGLVAAVVGGAANTGSVGLIEGVGAGLTVVAGGRPGSPRKDGGLVGDLDFQADARIFASSGEIN